MRFFNIIGAFGVLTCNIIVSYNHSIELFQSGGFHGWMAHVAVIGAETTFILGALNIVVARLRGVSPGAPAVLGGLLGVALVSWSNAAAGWSHGLPGILLGLATPASLIVAEAMLSREILQRRAAMERAERERAERRTEERKPEGSAKVSTPAKDSTPVIPTTPSTPAKVFAPVVEEKGRLQVEREEKREEKENRRPVVEKEGAARIAMKIYREEGKLPGRKRLMEEAGVSEWEARKTLQELRQKVG